MTLVVLHIKTLFRHYPSVSGVPKDILMEVTDSIRITFVYLTEAFILNRLLDSLAIDL